MMAFPKFESFTKYITRKKMMTFPKFESRYVLCLCELFGIHLCIVLIPICINYLNIILNPIYINYFLSQLVQIDLTLNSTYQNFPSLILELTHSFLCHKCTIEKHVQNFFIFFIALYETKISTISCGKPLALHRYHHRFSCLQTNECLLGLTFPHFQKEKNQIIFL